MNKAIKQYLERHGFGQFCPKAVLFDMDGVLYDSMPWHAEAWHDSMAEFGITMTHADAYEYEGARGIDTIRQIAMRQQGREISEAAAQKMYEEKSRLFHLKGEAPLMPGIMTLMQQLHDNGLSINVVTGSGQRPLIARLIKDFGQWLDEKHITTAYDVERGKPNPDPYLIGLQKAGGLNPWEAIVVENAPLGVHAGVAAKIFTIAVNTGPLPDERLRSEGANIVLPDILSLCRSIDSIVTMNGSVHMAVDNQH